MSTMESGTPRRSYRVILFLSLIVIIGLLGGAYYLQPRFERDPPQIKFTPDLDVLGPAPMEIVISDKGAGLKSVTATLSSGGSEHTLASEQYAEPVSEKKITVVLSSKLPGIKEGPAVLRVSARDRSLWNFFRGSETVIQKTLTVDITHPPSNSSPMIATSISAVLA